MTGGSGGVLLTPEQKRAALAHLLRDKAAREASQPLSHGQRALWLTHQMAPDSAAYNVSLTVRVDGLDEDAMRRALNGLAARHEMLRSRYPVEDGMPVVRIPAIAEVPFQTVDATGWSRVAMDEGVRGVSGQPFDLGQGPVMRATLFRQQPGAGVFLLTVHHIAIDALSIGIIAGDLVELYAAAREQRAPALAPLTSRYSDFTHWLDARTALPAGEALWAFWRERLAGPLPFLDLPTDRPRPATQSFRGASQAFRIEPEDAERWRAFAKRQGTTLYVVLYAAFTALLHRYTGQTDLLVGTPTAGRTRPEFEGLVGYFVNPVVLRTRIETGLTFTQHVERSRQAVLEALDHADLPFPVVVQRLNPPRDPSRSPIFQVDFNVVKVLPRGANTDGLEGDGSVFRMQAVGTSFEFFHIAQQDGQFDLSLEIYDTVGALTGFLRYATDLFDADRIARVVDHFHALLDAALERPDLPLGDLNILTTAEAHAVAAWNATERSFAGAAPIHRLIEEQVRRTPDAPALRFEGRALRYRDLNRRANVLARRLKGAGVGENVLVGVVSERSFEMVVALLAVLKAGGAYVPLDPSYPADRIGFMLEDIRATVIVAQRSLVGVLPPNAAQVIELEDFAEGAGEHDENLAGSSSIESLAYAIFTSGSTGRPKGAMNAHRGVCNRLLWMQAEYGLKPSDRVLQKTPYSFDVSVWEFFWPLMTGATLVIARPEGHKDPRYLAELIREEGITTLHFVPSMLQAFLEDPASRGCSSVARVVCSGEALPHELMQRFFEALPGAALHNLYGPTEAAVDVTYWECRRDDARSYVPIGRPVANTQIHLLDPHGHPVPIGIRGELYIGGVQVGAGYCNRPELTAERFVPDPFRADPAARMYRTGDLARYDAGGVIEYLGRTDHQVKIRGQRIELGEIEATLEQYPGVEQAVVLAREHGPGDLRLVAYVTHGAAPLPGEPDLRRHLQSKLPAYMVPSSFAFLDAFPLTQSGKTDRTALAALEEPRAAGATTEFVAARTPTEEIVAGIWSEILGVTRVSAQADFFELGGHSLSATQVVTRVRKAFDVDLLLRDLFSAPTVAALAHRIDSVRHAGLIRPEAPAPAAHRWAGATGPLSSAQQRLWFLDQLGGETTEYSITGAVEMTGRLDEGALVSALESLVERHESLRTTFAVADGEPVQVVQPATGWKPGRIDLTGGAEETLRECMRAESRLRFDLAQGPLFRATLFRLASDRHLLHLAMHHIVSDGWSLGILVGELQGLYARAAGHDAPPLAPPKLQYRDYARWQRAHFGAESWRPSLERWTKRLDGAPRQIELPSDRPRPAAESHRGAVYTFTVDAAVTDGLKRLSRAQGATLFMTLLAAFDTLLWRYTGQEDLVVGSPVANRTHADLEGVVGVFVNTVLLRTRLHGNPRFTELLARARETSLDALSDAGLPFERLVEALRPERDLSRNPLFQVMLVLQNAPLKPLQMADLTLGLGEIDREAAQLDLTLYVMEDEDRLKVFIEYATDLFDDGRIDRMAGHLERILRAVALDPAIGVAELPMLTDRELTEVRAWNGTERAWPQACVHDAIKAQAERTPDRAAVDFEGETLSYARLDERASAVASGLAALGVKPGSLVGVLLERSPDMLAGVLGVMKAGGAYVPMDPAFPPDRLAYMLEDSGADVLLTQKSLSTMFETKARILLLDAPTNGQESAVVEAPGLDDLAYVIYTSGSTGKPKGVAITHRALANLLWSMKDEPGFEESDSLLAVTTLSFDIAGLELYLPLLAGGRVVLANRDEVSDGRRLVERLRSSGATVMQATPATWRLMLESGWEGDKALKALCGGEALPRDLADTLLERVGELWNVYGPTETTIWSSCGRVGREAGAISIGRPIANTTMYVLDAAGAVAPIGVTGELHIGGTGLARGYWKRPELTAERFIERLIDGHRVRLYKTGDQARWLADGRIECLGRLDHQVKVRGYRIELEEIEVALRSLQGVEEAVVVAAQGSDGDQRLAAYLTQSAGGQPNVTEIRNHLRRSLPAYMVPSSFIFLDRLPLTPNGKIDRKALGGLQGGASPRAAATPPRTPTEKYVAELWRKALGVPEVGLQDNFFDLGGHSLLSMRVLAAIEKDTGTRLHPRDIIFQNLEQLAAACGEAAAVGVSRPEPAAGRFRNALRGFFPSRGRKG